MNRFQKIFLTLILMTAIGLLFSKTMVHILTESWWFDAVGFAEVFWTRITWQILVWVGTFVLYFLFLWGNYWLAMRLSRDRLFRFLRDSYLEPYTKTFSHLVALVVIFLVALNAANSNISAWETLLKYFYSTDFNLVEPIYHKDISFYFFQLPLYESIYRGLLLLCALALILSASVYILKGKITSKRPWKRLLSGPIKTHLSLLLAAIAFLIAVGFWLERYELLYSSAGVVFGAGYTDVHSRLIAYWVMSLAALVLGMLFVLAVWQNNIALPAYGVGFYLVALLLVDGFYPWFQQQFIVEPNELDKELPYIKHNIEFTRNAYGLNEVQTKEFPAHNQLNRQDLQANQSTISNIRLWDYRPLLDTYRQLQEIRLYYKFNDVDIDRYTFEDNYQQVMLSARELSYDQVPAKAQTWVNQRLKYTHGYGLVMNSVNQFTADGLPELLLKNIPPVSQVNLPVTQPGIYYGESTDTYIFTGTLTPEFDYPLGDKNAFTNYQGKGGVPIPSLWHRLAYAYDLGSLKILISNYFSSDSHIHYYRQIQQRVSQVAPFLGFDSDPYMTVIDGKLKWIIDAYTLSDRFPYSQPVLQNNDADSILPASQLRRILRRNVNYIRNSVKVVVDAYDGTMKFLVVDEQDPVLATYRQIFPTLFQSQDQISSSLKAHFRYPRDLFKIQAQMYLSYHMRVPQVFYNQEDLWRFPTEVYEGNKQLMEPYYIIMRLPEEQEEEFILIMPFTPVNKDNMIAWMAARSDGENYGKLLLYEFSKQELVYGPSQIEARIDQNPEISQQLTLWSQEGSRVIRGDLLVIPIEKSLLYVEPVYLRAEQGQLPQLKRVIVAYHNQTVMAKTLEDCLAVIFGDRQLQEPITRPTEADFSNLVEKAIDTYQKAQAAIREGDWNSYGQYQEELGNLLQQLHQIQESD